MEPNQATPNLFEPLLTLADIMQIFPTIDEKTIYNWRQAEILKDIVIGGCLFFSPQNVMDIKTNGMPYSKAPGVNKRLSKKKTQEKKKTK